MGKTSNESENEVLMNDTYDITTITTITTNKQITMMMMMMTLTKISYDDDLLLN